MKRTADRNRERERERVECIAHLPKMGHDLNVLLLQR